ncbi:MAG: DUF3426 domain-containing protein [Steroidobacteraceae bacterium]|nr:DUF3426 domain-containing protein [Steroidobacteraceae bacterium]
MFTVCPKCALTLVVTAADLRVAQGYVRCGRCSNVFNAIAALSEDRQGLTGITAQSGGASRQSAPSSSAGTSTATTSVIRKAPSLAQEEPESDPLSETGELECIYAEPDFGPENRSADEDELFVEAPPPTDAPARTSSATSPPGQSGSAPASRAAAEPSGQSARSGSTPGAGTSTSPASPHPDAVDDVDAIPDTALEFNPEATDVSQVFIEAPPPKKIDLRAESPISYDSAAPEEGGTAAPPRKPERDPEDIRLENELKALAARLDERDDPAPADAEGAAVTRFSGSPYNTADAHAQAARKTRRSSAAASAATADRAHATPADDDSSAVAAELSPRPPRRAVRIAWIAGCIVLALALAAQVVHFNRHDLATHPRLNRPLTRLYAALGVPLVPRWNLASYDVRQLGAFTSEGGSGNLTVRASLRNSAKQPLPLPLLRITVQDRYGNRIATRDVPPKGYVPGAVPDGALIGAGQRIDAEMTFKDPGRDAVGFEIDACLPAPGGRIACANDAR